MATSNFWVTTHNKHLRSIDFFLSFPNEEGPDQSYASSEIALQLIIEYYKHTPNAINTLTAAQTKTLKQVRQLLEQKQITLDHKQHTTIDKLKVGEQFKGRKILSIKQGNGHSEIVQGPDVNSFLKLSNYFIYHAGFYSPDILTVHLKFQWMAKSIRKGHSWESFAYNLVEHG